MWLLLVLLLRPDPAAAHATPFSYIDLHLRGASVKAVVTLHVFDLAHELGVTDERTLLEPSVIATRAAAITALIESRLGIRADDVRLVGQWSAAESLRDRESLRFEVTYATSAAPGLIGVTADLFPYDPEHRTFLNVYEEGALVSQDILEGRHHHAEHFLGSRQGALAVARRFVPAGIHHILIGPDHILFLVGLMLTGGSLRRLLLIVTSFTAAHSVTLTLAALSILIPPPWLVEPAIALSIVYVGLDNLLRGSGRDLRAWIAFGFGFIHGFGFAYLLRDMGLPAEALGTSLLSFNVGVEVGQVLVVLTVGAALYAVRTRSPLVAARVTTVGSVVVILAGAYWFVERTLL